MDEESKNLLRQTLELTEENNKILHSMRRSQRIASFVRVIYWLVAIGIGVGSFYLLQPYLDKADSFIKSSSATIDQFKSIGNKIPQ